MRSRIAREERTIAAMVELYCRDHHAPSRGRRDEAGLHDDELAPGDVAGLCPDCAALLGYARRRLAACRYGAAKPACTACATHCYKPAMREQVRVVMRYAGPRMLRRHPLLAAAHLMDKRRAPGGGAAG